MSYDDPLTEADFAAFHPNDEVVRYLEQTREHLGLQKHETRVLDWGSGRGEYVTWLRDAGYDAFGAEIREEAAERGRTLLQAHGHDYARVIARISADVKTMLPANYFHFVFTHYVLEHVADIDAVTREIARLTAPGGCGFHVYPGKLRPIEPHLFMPFVHWLPKNPARKWAIATFVACGIDPRWGWLAAASRSRKVNAYYEFCNNETFYRSFRDVRRSFTEKGFAVTSVSADHPALHRLSTLPAGLRERLVEWPVMLFQTVEILVSKPHSHAA
ncbi:MAG: class I SAM-dependent methyltransferase [Alphaproteobacteria bacterium]|nr:class I SAM-dependent methyltransferase [Alphaproteobacteria bacterium]